MKRKAVAEAANFNYNTACKRKKTMSEDPEEHIPLKKNNRTCNCNITRLTDSHKDYLISYFDENPTAVIQEAVED